VDTAAGQPQDGPDQVRDCLGRGPRPLGVGESPDERHELLRAVHVRRVRRELVEQEDLLRGDAIAVGASE